jgi:hypothetical protein
MASSILCRVPAVKGDWPDYFPNGTFRKEDRLVARLQAFSERHGLPKGLSVHVYETGATKLGIGRRHLGTISAGFILMARGINLNRVVD